MNLDNAIFTNRFPKLDLHGIECDIAKVMVNDFIADNLKLKNKFVVIVHGIGHGILKKEVMEVLKTNKAVLDYKMPYNNIGCTIAMLSID